VEVGPSASWSRSLPRPEGGQCGRQLEAKRVGILPTPPNIVAAAARCRKRDRKQIGLSVEPNRAVFGIVCRRPADRTTRGCLCGFEYFDPHGPGQLKSSTLVPSLFIFEGTEDLLHGR
jgi:hypothetical protein